MFSNHIKSFEKLNSASIPAEGYLTPPQIAHAYCMPKHTGLGVRVGIISLGGGWLQSDINQSMDDLGLPHPTITQVLLNGETGDFQSNLNSSLENTLDIYCIAATIPEADIRIYIAENSLQGFSNAIFAAIDEECDVISISWGLSESVLVDFEVGDFLQKALDTASARKISVFVASGDYGSTAETYDTEPFAGYPASSPQVTAVGGTTLTLNEYNERDTEVADRNSGGGLSVMFNKPSYQHNCYYTAYGGAQAGGGAHPVAQLAVRGVPDIAAPMRDYVFYFDGEVVVVGGTSAATPMMASMTARFVGLLEHRLGNMNPVFYANRGAFSDLTTGDDLALINRGYLVSEFWDPIVGLGAPNAAAIYQALNPYPTIAIKDEYEHWQTVSNAYVKTSDIHWKPVKAVWTKTVDSWTQVCYGTNTRVETILYDVPGDYEYTIPLSVSNRKLSVLAIGGGAGGSSSVVVRNENPLVADVVEYGLGGNNGTHATQILNVYSGETIGIHVGTGGGSDQGGTDSYITYNGIQYAVAGGAPQQTLRGEQATDGADSQYTTLIGSKTGGSVVANDVGSDGNHGGGGAGGSASEYYDTVPDRELTEKTAYINGYPAGGVGPPLGIGTLATPGANYRFDTGIIPILQNLDPDNCSNPTGDMVVVGTAVTQQQLTNFGIQTPLTNILVGSAGESVNWSITFTVDHNVGIGYWIWDANGVPTKTLTHALYYNTYGAPGRQTDTVSRTLILPAGFTSTSILVLGMGDVSLTGSTGSQNIYSSITGYKNITRQVYRATEKDGGAGGNGTVILRTGTDKIITSLP